MTQPGFLTILLADDDPDDIEMITTAFNFADTTLHLHTVEDGVVALDYLEAVSPEDSPCLIILDYNMPRMNGLEVLKLLKDKKRYQFIPKVIMTTSNHEQLKKNCLENGADKFLVKPNTYSELINIAKDLIRWCREGISAGKTK